MLTLECNSKYCWAKIYFLHRQYLLGIFENRSSAETIIKETPIWIWTSILISLGLIRK